MIEKIALTAFFAFSLSIPIWTAHFVTAQWPKPMSPLGGVRRYTVLEVKLNDAGVKYDINRMHESGAAEMNEIYVEWDGKIATKTFAELKAWLFQKGE